MKKFVSISLLALTGCAGSTYEYTSRTPYGVHRVDVNEGALRKHVSETWDSKEEYEDCMSTVNRRQLGGISADQYCREQTRDERRGKGYPGSSSMLRPAGYGYGSMVMPAGFGPGMYYGPGALYAIPPSPPGRRRDAGTPTDPAYALAVVNAHRRGQTQPSSGGRQTDENPPAQPDDGAMDAVLLETANTANRVRELEERLDRQEVRRSRTPVPEKTGQSK
jgi:hypothetical protein